MEGNRQYPTRLSEGLIVLGHDYFHHYLMEGRERTALVEAGVSATADLVLGQLESLGVRPDYLVVSHPHVDHINGLPALRTAFPDATVIAGEGAPEFLAHPGTKTSLVADDRFITQFLAGKGLRTKRPPIEEPPSLDGCRIVRDGERIDLGGRTLVFLAAPGHSPGNLAVHVPETGVLLASDSLGYHLPRQGFFPIFFTGYDDYMATIDRFETLKPRFIGLPHHGCFSGEEETPRAFAEARRAARETRARILGDARPDEDILRDLYHRSYRDELTIYSQENIIGCCRLLLRRSRQSAKGETS
ncbi:MAG: MBL fold metallo-hydrolase [Syntrophaceae bacterium]|nr:MBL fold metallo-hydrolase [Syntrophaceae bacterium]